MGIFSRIMAGKDKEIISEEVSIGTYLQDVANNGTSEAEEEASLLLEGTISVEERLEKLRQEKEDIMNLIDELLRGREEIIKAKTNCQSISKKQCTNQVKKFEDYIECQDFKSIPEKADILKLIREIAPEVYQVSEIPITEVGLAVQELYENWSEIENEVQVLKEEGDVLRVDINQFVATTNELKNKYKLSPDWEGKKPGMMTYQSKLKERREAYLRKEQKVDTKLEVLYDDYSEVYEAFVSCGPYIEQVLERKADDFAKEPDRVSKLQELLKAKQRVELEIAQYNK